jgi:putative ABC transport system permease protein
VAEVALAVVLVVGAGLLARSLVALTSVDMGFDAERLLVLRTVVPVRSLQDAPRATAFYRELLEDVRSTPGVTTAAAVTSLPTQVRSNGGYWIEGGPTIDETGVSAPQALFTVVTPDYFRTLRVPIRRGRDFTDGDRLGAPMVAIINESLARQAFPGQDPIGRRIQCGLDSLEFMTIVGVVADVRTAGPAQPAMPELFMPYEQHPGPAAALNLVVRTESDNPLSLTETIRRKIASRNPDVPVKATTMDATLENAAATYRFRTYLLVLFASVALLLAVAGIYGVMSYTVSQRTPELGVRIALGATPGDIFGLVVGQGAWLAAIGIVIGGALSLIAGRLLEGLLFGVTARDPWSLAGVTVVVLIASLAACYLPGRRAVRVDPMVALRAE